MYYMEKRKSLGIYFKLLSHKSSANIYFTHLMVAIRAFSLINALTFPVLLYFYINIFQRLFSIDMLLMQRLLYLTQ